MTLIHAYRRAEGFPLALFGKNYIFKAHPDFPAAIVCEVPEQKAVDRLLFISEAYVKFGDASPAAVLADNGLTTQNVNAKRDAERELGFDLDSITAGRTVTDETDIEDPDVDVRSPEQRAFADAEAARVAAEAQDEADAIAERNRLIANAEAQKRAADEELAADAMRQGELNMAKLEGKMPAEDPKPEFILQSGSGKTAVKVDLNPMSDEMLRDFAKEQGLTRIKKDLTGDELRQAIVDKFNAA